MPMQLLRNSAIPALCIMALLAPFAHAQQPALPTGTPPPALDPNYTPSFTFDIASIRENAHRDGDSLKVGVNTPVHSTKFEATNFPIKSLIQLAYGFGTPISGGPDWMSDKYFNVEAKSDPAMDEKMARLSDDDARMEKQHMVQVMLAERLGLKAHWETRETSVYLLEIAKGGSKLEELKPPAPDPDPSHPAPPPPANADVKTTGGAKGLEFVAQSSNSRAIAAMLVSQLNQPVIDKTGLNGSYKFVLQFGREWSSSNPESWPDIRTAVQEQLGLKLEPTKAAVPVLIIDHIDLPSAN